MTPPPRLTALGTSVWLDGLVPSAELERLVRDEHVTGLTSNPATFRSAVLVTDRYAARIAGLAGRPPAAIYETLAIHDVRAAADVLAPVYAEPSGAEDFVSLEVAPALTGTRDAGYSDVKYVDELAGPGVVNTMPPATLAAFAHHGDPYDCLTGAGPAARVALDEIAAAGIDLDAVTRHLLEDGVDRFAAAIQDLLTGLAAPAAA